MTVSASALSYESPTLPHGALDIGLSQPLGVVNRQVLGEFNPSSQHADARLRWAHQDEDLPSELATRQPTMPRENASITKATHTKPRQVAGI